MKITLGQINTTPNDFEGNFEKIKQYVDRAIQDDSDVVVFPELCIPGYLVRDLVYTTGFVERNLQYLNKVCRLTENNNLTVIVGYITKNTTGYGKPFCNMAAVIRHGVVIATHQKRLLPMYSVFEEAIYYEPGNDNCVFEIAGNKCGLLICEEVWRNDKGETGNLRYEDDPISDLKQFGISHLFCINCSPYAKDKPAKRRAILKSLTKSWPNNLNLIYVNQIGGNDELVMDGHSMIITRNEVFTYINNTFDPTDTYKIANTTYKIPTYGVNSPYRTFNPHHDHLQMILIGLYDYITKCGFKSVVLGSSGGVDSALVASLAALAIGGSNVNCIMMPSCYSSEGSVNDAKELHRNIGCNEYLVPIDHMPLLDHIKKNLNLTSYFQVADENLQSRMRGQIVMHYSNAMGSLALTTGNKTELSTGYCTLYGDTNGGFNPIGDLYKMEVYDICKQINNVFGKTFIPNNIISKAPSAELKPDQTDEDSLLPYIKLDPIIKLYIEDYITSYDEYSKVIDPLLKVSKEEYDRISNLVYKTEFKRRQCAPTIKLSNVAFGTGRRLPIVKK